MPRRDLQHSEKMVDSKQVKVDNWGIFFLQRLQQFYNKSAFCDLTLRFEDNIEIKVHRLVMSACTEYFQALEKLCSVEKDCLMMPSNLTSDVVIPIINFMYSGILEFHESSFDRLYSTAKLMNMSVLTKLLDAQKTPIKPIPKRVQSVTPITWNLQGRRITTKTYVEPDLPETLPGRKLPIWKRKSAPSGLPYLSSNNFESFSPKVNKQSYDEPPKPTRFEWPEEHNSFENSFDDISYESKPLIMPAVIIEKSPKPSTSTFEEIKRTILPVKRSASPLGNQCKRVNIQDVKEYLKEHKIRSDYIDYDDSQITDNDLQTFDNDDSNEEQTKDEAVDVAAQNVEDTPNKSILKYESTPPSNKHVRFSLDGKENLEKKVQPVTTKTVKTNVTTSQQEQEQDMSKHKKIITEVLKKYPHLVKNNKNIRLKILAKGAPLPPNIKTPLKTSTPVKQPSKISYKVINPEPNQKPQSKNDKEQTSWECTQCEEPLTFTSYLTYRQHLTEVHNEKQDSQMCNVCGHISRKQNMLVYHKFVKHNIPPPVMFNFPKCKECGYVALSPIILQKHIAAHGISSITQETPTNYACKECNLTFTNKTSCISHIQQTGHVQDRVSPPWGCSYCDKMFFSENNLNMHMKRSHSEEIKRDIDKEPAKTKEKIKILSDVKVSPSISNQTYELKAEEEVLKTETQPEQSSEAEALSNVASGIAASLGLVDTIVVLDDNQFILQSQHGNIQQNINNEYILPHMQINEIPTSSSQHPTVALSSDTNAVLTQSFHKSGITSTDELVMVLTDHDYSDGTNNAVITDNNIVVLYSHPVQTQAGTMMITSEAGMIEVDKNYTQNIPVTITEQQAHCEESIEMIQQEINSQLETNTIQQDQNTLEASEYEDLPQIDVNTEIIVIQQPEIGNINLELDKVSKENTQINENIQVINEHIQEDVQQEYAQMQENQSQLLGDEQAVQETQMQELEEKETEELREINEEEALQETQVQSDEAKMQEIYDETQLKMKEIHGEEIEEIGDIQIQEEMQEREIIAAYEEAEIEKISNDNEHEHKMSEDITPNVENRVDATLQNEENIVQEENATQNDEPQIVSEIEENLPSLEESVPEIEENVSEIEENLPQTEENVPEVEENASEFEENLPQTEVNTPEVEENISELKNLPKIEENVPELMENVSEIIENVTELQENLSQIEEKPEIEDNVSELENLGQIKEKVQEIVPELEERVQEIKEDVPEIEENIPPLEEVKENLSTDEIVEENQNAIEESSNIEELSEENKDQIEEMTTEQQETVIEVQKLPETIENYDMAMEVDLDSPNINKDETKIEEIDIEMKEEMDSQKTLTLEAEETNDKVLFTVEKNINTSSFVEVEPPVNIDNSKPEDMQINSEENFVEQNVKESVNDSIGDSICLDSQESKLDNSQILDKVQDVQFTQTNAINMDIQNESPTEEVKISEDVNVTEKDTTDQEKSSENNTLKNDNGSQIVLRNERISKLLDDWDDGDTDSQQSFSKSTPEAVNNSINKLIDDWDDEEDS